MPARDQAEQSAAEPGPAPRSHMAGQLAARECAALSWKDAGVDDASRNVQGDLQIALGEAYKQRTAPWWPSLHRERCSLPRRASWQRAEASPTPRC